MKSRTLSTLRALAMTAVVVLANIGTAEAGRVTGRFDPPFGGSGNFGNLSWMGTAEFTIPDACLDIPGTNVQTFTVTDACYGMRMDSANVSFYATSDPNKVQVGYFDVNFVPILPAFPFAYSPVTAVAVTISKEVSGIAAPGSLAVLGVPPGTPIYGEAFSDGDGGLSDAFAFLNDLWFSISFDLTNGPSLIYCHDSGITPILQYGLKNGFCTSDTSGASDPTIPVTFSFRNMNLVPEPGSISLVLAALAIGAGVRRRRK